MKRQRVTITLKKDIVQQVDRLIDNLKIRSRSQAIEYLLSKTLSDLNITNVLILAGGRRKEMGKLTEKTPRSMLLIKGKPILQHIIERLHSFNINHFMIYTDYFGKRVVDYFGDGSKFGVKIEYLKSEKPKGTIYPLELAREKINDTFLLVNGDTVCSLDMTDFMNFHSSNQNLATVALTSVSNPKDYGVITLKGNNITSFQEKPTTSVDSYLVSAGLYIFEPKIFNYLSKNMKSIEKDLFPSLVEKNVLSGYPFQGLWMNINTPKDLKKARIIL